MQMLRAQIMAYRMLARNQPLTKQIQAVIQSPRADGTPPQCPTPPASGQPNPGYANVSASIYYIFFVSAQTN